MAMEMQDLSAALSRLRSISVRLSLDDFGTGHSSLAALHRLPVQEVKIDRSFVKEIGGSAYHQAVVQAALHVAGELKLAVVAEGVETTEQAALLSALGCPSAQGWLYSKAVEQDNVVALLRRPSLLPPAQIPVGSPLKTFAQDLAQPFEMTRRVLLLRSAGLVEADIPSTIRFDDGPVRYAGAALVYRVTAAGRKLGEPIDPP